MTIKAVRRPPGAWPRAARILDQEMTRTTQEIAQVVDGLATSEAPIRTGKLASEIRVEPTENGTRVVIDSSDFPQGFYPRHVHFGTKHIEADRFLEDAGQNYQAGARRDYRRGIRRSLRRIAVR